MKIVIQNVASCIIMHFPEYAYNYITSNSSHDAYFIQTALFVHLCEPCEATVDTSDRQRVQCLVICTTILRIDKWH